MNVGIQDGLIDPKHEKAMSNAVWLFLWCVRCETQKTGFVLGGIPLTYKEIARRSGFPVRRIRFWMDRLRRHNYIRVTYTNYKMLRIEIMKPKKWFPKQQTIKFPSHRQETVSHDRQKTVSTVTENCQSNKSSSLRENYKTPLPPADAGDRFLTLSRYGEEILIHMGNRRRPPNLEPTAGLRAKELAEYLTARGFPSELIKKE